MSQELRRKVLGCFKQLHRTRLKVFQGDDKTLAAAREKINAEFRKKKNVSDVAVIEELVTYGRQVEGVLRVSVLQAVDRGDGVYTANIRPELAKLDTSQPYRPMPDSMIGPFRGKKTRCTDS